MKKIFKPVLIIMLAGTLSVFPTVADTSAHTEAPFWYRILSYLAGSFAASLPAIFLGLVVFFKRRDEKDSLKTALIVTLAAGILCSHFQLYAFVRGLEAP